MRIQLASDLHQEHLAKYVKDGLPVEPDPRADVLVLAGDIFTVDEVVRIYGRLSIPVLYVLGNHEFYGTEWAATRARAQDLCRGTQVHVLDNQAFVLGDVRFLGATLWTDFALNGTPELSALRVEAALWDYKGIAHNKRRFRAMDSLADHQHSRSWLESELAKPFDGKTVLVTHHGPHPHSVHPTYAGDPINPGFVSDLGPLLDSVDLALHGHVHNSMDYKVGRCRVVANPRGYPQRGSTLKNILFENPSYDPALVLEL